MTTDALLREVGLGVLHRPTGVEKREHQGCQHEQLSSESHHRLQGIEEPDLREQRGTWRGCFT